MPRCAVLTDQPRQYLDQPSGADAASDIDRQGLACMLIDDSEALQLLTICARVKHKIVGPHLVRRDRWHRTRPRACYTPPGPLSRHLQPSLPPQSMRPLMAPPPAELGR